MPEFLDTGLGDGSQQITFNSAGIKDLIAISIEALGRMQQEGGLFCQEVVKGNGGAWGYSIRYSIMVLLGLERARAAGWSHKFEVEQILDKVIKAIATTKASPGDLGLCLWIVARCRAGHSDDLINRLRTRLNTTGGFPYLQGMEVSWIVIGLAQTLAFKQSASTQQLFIESLTELIRRHDSKTGLLYHLGIMHPRRWLPNFATQIYGVLAFATVASLGLNNSVLNLARITADRLIALQLSDGGWPWLFNVRAGRVVEPYEIYSVHQDGMAPMALLALSEVSGDSRYANAAITGLEWIHGKNDLNRSMIDREEPLIYRSIRRKKPWDKLALYLNVGLSGLLGVRNYGFGRSLEVNLTCRPYELGWALEAWCGRDSILGAGMNFNAKKRNV